jgi:uncharacterized damage-inducible protein DinB
MVKKPASSPSDPTMTQLLKLFDQAYDRKSWHGPNLRGSLRGLKARQAAWRPAPGRHNIQELVVHAAYWKYAVRRRLTGEKRGSFAQRGSNWFARDGASEAAWRRDVELLAAEHKALRATIARLRGRDLDQRAPGSTVRIATLIRGAAAHDLYHAGQIQLLKRLSSS